MRSKARSKEIIAAAKAQGMTDNQIEKYLSRFVTHTPGDMYVGWVGGKIKNSLRLQERRNKTYEVEDLETGRKDIQLTSDNLNWTFGREL